MGYKREVKIVVISDVHLGTYGCHAKELLKYLKSIKAETIILNGDIIDVWQFSKRYFPKSHLKIIKYIMSQISKDTQVFYITGNHDEVFRKFKGFKIGNFEIVNQIVIEIDNKLAWFFHGDVFDYTMKNSKWLAKLGAVGYDALIHFNTFCSFISKLMGGDKISLSKKVKNSVKQAIKFIDDFEQTAISIALTKGYDYVVCGHIHHPEIKEVTKDNQTIQYLNSGDWIENLTALEYYDGKWHLYEYNKDAKNLKDDILDQDSDADEVLTNKELFWNMVETVNNENMKPNESSISRKLMAV